MGTATISKNDETTTDTRYFPSSVTDVEHFAYAVRKHWAIENQTHWCLDVIFDEDASRARKDMSPLTVTNELERGTPPRRSSKGKAPGYSPKRGEAVYKAHRVNSCKPRKAESCKPFIARVVKQAREHKWSLDACCGYAKRQFLFNEQNCRIKQICSLPKDNLQPAYPRRHRELSRFLFKCTQIYS